IRSRRPRAPARRCARCRRPLARGASRAPGRAHRAACPTRWRGPPSATRSRPDAARGTRAGTWSGRIRTWLAFGDRYPFAVLGAGVVGPGTDDLAVGALLDDVRGPAARARYD